MKIIKKIATILALVISVTSCKGGTMPKYADSVDDTLSREINQTVANTNEKNFRQVLVRLKSVLLKKDLQSASSYVNFPFYTNKQAEGEGNGLAIDPILANDYQAYKKDIFNADVLHLLPKYTEEQLSEIDSKTDDKYYRSLEKLTDRGTKLYEVYFQYPEKGTNAENYFAFVFGMVKGKYKAIAMYSKWPVK